MRRVGVWIPSSRSRRVPRLIPERRANSRRVSPRTCARMVTRMRANGGALSARRRARWRKWAFRKAWPFNGSVGWYESNGMGSSRPVAEPAGYSVRWESSLRQARPLSAGRRAAMDRAFRRSTSALPPQEGPGAMLWRAAGVGRLRVTRGVGGDTLDYPSAYYAGG